MYTQTLNSKAALEFSDKTKLWILWFKFGFSIMKSFSLTLIHNKYGGCLVQVLSSLIPRYELSVIPTYFWSMKKNHWFVSTYLISRNAYNRKNSIRFRVIQLRHFLDVKKCDIKVGHSNLRTFFCPISRSSEQILNWLLAAIMVADYCHSPHSINYLAFVFVPLPLFDCMFHNIT